MRCRRDRCDILRRVIWHAWPLAGAWQAWCEFTGGLYGQRSIASIQLSQHGLSGTAQLVRMGYECQRRKHCVRRRCDACSMRSLHSIMVHHGRVCSPECSGAARCSALPEQVTAGRVFPVAIALGDVAPCGSRCCSHVEAADGTVL